MNFALAGSFRLLGSFNYLVWGARALVSDVGTWLQRTAQDWLVPTQLTHHSASAVGVVMAIRLGIALGGTPVGAPIVGWIADRFGPRWALGLFRPM